MLSLLLLILVLVLLFSVLGGLFIGHNLFWLLIVVLIIGAVAYVVHDRRGPGI